MKFHHLGVACKDIEKAIKEIRKIYDVTAIGQIYYDELQDAKLCLIYTNNGMVIELISGDQVINILKKGTAYYHVCYTVSDLEGKVGELVSNGCILVSPPKPAILFENRKVAFVLSDVGLLEFLEEG